MPVLNAIQFAVTLIESRQTYQHAAQTLWVPDETRRAKK